MGCCKTSAALSPPFSSGSCLSKRCASANYSKCIRELSGTEQPKITGEWRNRIGACAAAIVFEMKMWKESVGMLARIEEWCNKKVQIKEFLTFFVGEGDVEIT